MAQFLGDIAVMLEVLVFGVGAAIWYWGSRERSTLLAFTGGVLVVSAVLGAVCSIYYYLNYHYEGDFKNAYPMHQMMGSKMMGDGAMIGPGASTPMRQQMMQNMNACMAQMQGQTMDTSKMMQMRECMMGQMSKEMPSQK